MSSFGENTSAPLSQVTVQTGGKRGINCYENIDIKECVKIRIFPAAKFLRLEDLPYTGRSEKQSWCRKMAAWCNIQGDQVEVWWGAARKIIIQELGFQRSTKNNKIKEAFFGKRPSLTLTFLCHC